MSWMGKVKPEEKTNPVPPAGTTKILQGSVTVQYKIGDIFGNFILLGPLYTTAGLNIIYTEIWVDMRSLNFLVPGFIATTVEFDGKTDLNHPVQSWVGAFQNSILQLLP